MKNCEQKYILTQDTTSLLELFGPTDGLEPFVAGYLGSLTSIIENTYMKEQQIVVQSFAEADINFQLGSAVQNKLERDQNGVIICADRFLLKDIEEKYPERFGRLSITRRTDGTKGQRPGYPALAKQFQDTAKRFSGVNITLVDDGIFSGGTIKEIVDGLTNAGIKPERLTEIIGYIGAISDKTIQGIPTTILNPVENLFEWVDIRDFAPWGGKQTELSSDGSVAYAIPYIFPWSDGAGASFNTSGSFFADSKKMIAAYGRVISAWGQINNRPLTFQNFVAAGVSLPTTNKLDLKPDFSETVLGYLERCQQAIEYEEQRKVIIFDMDGTLYELEGPQNTYQGSKLEKQVNANAINFIAGREQCSIDSAQEIWQTGLQDPIGLSNYLSNRYQISRKEYFDTVWNIDPEGVIKNTEVARDILLQCAASTTKCVLVTGAAKIWQQNVVRYLGIENAFEEIITSEDFRSKSEIFARMSQRYRPENIISVGDQVSTDIEPAKAYGLNTLLVANPNEITKLLE